MKKVPSEFDPESATTSPTVGANCHRGEQTYAMGRLKLEPMDARGFGEALCAEEHTRIDK